MLVKLTKGFSVLHKVVQIINFNNELVMVYNKEKGIDQLQNSLGNAWFKFPVEILVNTPEILIVKQINIDKIEKLKV